MRELCFFVPVRFPSLNELIGASNASHHAGGRLKRRYTEQAALFARAAARREGWHAPDGPAEVRLTWVERDCRRDQDNVTSAQKYLLDGLVEAGVLNGDSQRWIPQPSRNGITYDKRHPGVWVRIREEARDGD